MYGANRISLHLNLFLFNDLDQLSKMMESSFRWYPHFPEKDWTPDLLIYSYVSHMKLGLIEFCFEDLVYNFLILARINNIPGKIERENNVLTIRKLSVYF